MTPDECRFLAHRIAKAWNKRRPNDEVLVEWVKVLAPYDVRDGHAAVERMIHHGDRVPSVVDLVSVIRSMNPLRYGERRSDWEGEFPQPPTGEAIPYEEGIRIAMREATKVRVERRLAVGLPLDASSEALWAAELEARVRRAVPKPSDEDVMW